MRISELIKHLETIKDQNGDLICTSERWSTQGEGLLSEKNIILTGIKRPSGRQKFYRHTHFLENIEPDFMVLSFGRSGIDNIEG